MTDADFSASDHVNQRSKGNAMACATEHAAFELVAIAATCRPIQHGRWVSTEREEEGDTQR